MFKKIITNCECRFWQGIRIVKMDYLPIINTHFTLFGGHFETVKPGWHWKPEEHPAFELMYVMEGVQRTITETGELVLHAGQFTIIPIETRHINYVVGNHVMKYFCVHFDLDSPTLKYLLIRSYANRIIDKNDSEYDELKVQVEKLIRMIKPHYELADQLDIQINVFNLIMILTNALKQHDDFNAHQKDVDQFLLCQKIASDIKEKLDYEIYHASDPKRVSITKIVDQYHISQSYALKLFKKYFAESPQEYLVDLKLTAAKGLLLQPKSQIKEVSEKLAYAAPSHFSREFKKHFNITPREYVRIANSE